MSGLTNKDHECDRTVNGLTKDHESDKTVNGLRMHSLRGRSLRCW